MVYNMKKIIIYLILLCPFHTHLFAQEEPYNVLFIAVDDLNHYLGYLGGHPQVISPNFDRLASESVIFTNAHCPAPKCAPSRAAILTGVYPHENYVPVPYHFRDIPSMQDKTSLPQYFMQHGYKTISIGKIFHGWNGPKSDKDYSWNLHSGLKGDLTGYINTGPVAAPDSSEVLLDSCMNTNLYTIPQIGPLQISTSEYFETKTAEWTSKRLMQDYNKPVFIAHGFIRPHVPWYAPQEWFDLYQDSIILPIENQLNDFDDVPLSGQLLARPTEYLGFEECDVMDNQILAYLASISYVDHCLGIILDSLDASPLKDNTIVVLWSDHGQHVGEKLHVGKNTLWEESTSVPLLIKIPGLTQEGQIENAPVNLMDLFPTLIESCGLSDSIDVGGRSLLPLLEDERNDYNYPSLTTVDTFSHAIRTKQFRYIRYRDSTEELYNHNTDYLEWDNLVDDPVYDSTRFNLSAQMDDILLGGNGLMNEIPRINWLQPANHAIYSLESINSSASIPIELNAYDLDGFVDVVEIWIDDNLYETLSLAPYKSTWTPTTSGDYILKAVVKDNEGKEIWSRANHVHISDCSYSKIKHNTFDVGWGIWNGGGDDSRRDIKDAAYAYSGNYCIRLRNQSSSSFITSNSLNLYNYDEVSISFTYITKSMDDSTEDFFLEMSTDGGESFKIIEEWNLGDEFENGIREFDRVYIPGPFKDDVMFRFRCDASGYYDLVYLDNIYIKGCNNTSSRLNVENGIIKEFSAKIYPNPVKDELNLEYVSTDDIIIKMFDINGNLLLERKHVANEDINRIPLDVSHLNHGFYFLIVENGEERKTLKFVK